MTNHHLKIQDWAAEDRPREKLLIKGKASLSEAELIAILIGSGTATMSAVDLSRHILRQNGNNLNTLAKLTVHDLMKFKGIGEAKAISIVSALELGRRRKKEEVAERPKIKGSEDAYQAIYPELADLPHEEFWVILLSRANTLIKKHRISAGGLAGTVTDPKVVFKVALENNACGLILAHNHPSGNINPSEQDKQITRKLINAGKHLEIRVYDHLIIAEREYLSFADKDLM